jgi:hypothetical protein
MRGLIAALLLAASVPLIAGTTNNDNSCDIGTYPAATLLLPYFGVDIKPGGETTVFSITNVSASPQIARVTLWTDWSFPILSFNIFLTGYDVQPINLYDVIGRGLIGGTTGTSTDSPNARDKSGASTNPNLGVTPMTNLANPNFLTSASVECAPGRLPGILPAILATDVRALLTTGRSTGLGISCPSGFGSELQVGGNHGGNFAIGYATVDLVSICSPLLPTDRHYWDEILFDNVLTGDYQQIANDRITGNYAGGNPMVHIRAIPEGGAAGSPTATDLPFTFYNRFTTTDRRQPLPSTFAARWISGGNAAFETRYEIWREGFTGANPSCDHYGQNLVIPLDEIVRFDERENAGVAGSGVIIPEPVLPTPTTPATALIPVSNSLFPSLFGSTDLGGWIYFNLNNGGDARASRELGFAPYSASRPGYGSQPTSRDVSQNWVVVSMFAEGRFGVMSDATSLGNGCSPPAALTKTERIGPAKNANP